MTPKKKEPATAPTVTSSEPLNETTDKILAHCEGKVKPIAPTYREIDYYNLVDEILKGTLICCLDKFESDTFIINELSIERYLEIVEQQKQGSYGNYRYYFWTVEEGGGNVQM